VPIPDHISAKFNDLDSLISGLIETNSNLQKSTYDAVLAAATIAFGFVFIHPLTDGNGRIHRYIIHHILAAKNYVKRDLIFPISSAILDKIGLYQEILEDFTAPKLEWIEWKPCPKNNVEILNETIDLYRYGDLTKQAEFLYECVEDTIKRIIPEELEYLRKYDLMTEIINRKIALPNTKVDLLIKLLNQNNGKLSKVKQEKYFDELTIDQIEVIENDYKEIYLMC
jgi:Fic family protein